MPPSASRHIVSHEILYTFRGVRGDWGEDSLSSALYEAKRNAPIFNTSERTNMSPAALANVALQGYHFVK
jgi:hypothetical protein